MGNYIRAAGLSGFEDLVRSYGKDPIDILGKVGILPSVINETDSLIDYDRYLNLLELAGLVCNEECFGLKLAANQNIRTIGLIGVYISRQNSVLESLHVAQKYIDMHAEGFTFYANKLPNQLSELNILSQNAQNIDRPQEAQLAMCLMRNVIKDLIGPTWRPEKIKLKQNPTLESQQLLTKIFDCEVEFDTKKNALYFCTDLLARKPYHFNDDLVNQLILQQLENESTKSISNDTFLIESAMKMLLATGDCSIANVALCVGQHQKKVQRQLREQGTTYRELLEDVRKKEAIRIISTASIDLTDVALQLGYAELSIFSRQFKIWFGMTPTEWKNKSKKPAKNVVLV